MKRTIKILLALGLTTLFAFTNPEKLVFPTPPDTPQRLFYIQRSNNIHTVIYDANLDANKHLNPIEPIKVYWIRYGDRGQIQPLTYLQRRMAYGVETTKTRGGFDVQVVAFRKRKITVEIINGQPVALTPIAGVEASLHKVFVQLSDNESIVPKVAYIELLGKNLKTGNTIAERFVP